MKIFSESQYETQAKPILSKVFLNDDPYDGSFSPSIDERLIIFPCEPYLETNLVEGLIAAASYLGENSCFLTDLWLDPKRINHYLLSLSEFHQVQSGLRDKINFDSWTSYIIYSKKGTWGLMTSDESHGLLGGSPQFINKVREFAPNLNNQVYLFLKKLQSLNRPGARLEWVPGLFTHVYGQEKAEKMLKEAELL